MNFGAWMRAILCCAAFLAAQPVAGMDDRGQDLAREAEEMPATKKPETFKTQEPEREQPGSVKDRPTLKLPEVVVKGDRQFRAASERKDMLILDPMRDAHDMPADMDTVAIPGLDEEKGAPQADTLTARDYLFTAEAGGGLSQQGEARLVFGYEWPGADFTLRSEGSQSASPEAYGYQPLDQKITADLDISLRAADFLRLKLGTGGHWEHDRQPKNAPAGWGGDWLRRDAIQFGLDCSADLNPHSRLAAGAQVGRCDFSGNGDAPGLLSTQWSARFEYEHSVKILPMQEMIITAQAGLQSQRVSRNSQPDETEALRRLALIFRFHPLSGLHLNLGVQSDNLTGLWNRGASAVLAETSILLPTGTVVYANADGGLQWEPVAEWGFQNPHPAVFGLPAPERMRSYRAGWRQKLGENFSADLSWFRREAQETPVWLDPEQDGLFVLANLPGSLIQGAQAEIEIRYAEKLSQNFHYIYRDIQTDAGPALPYTPMHEARTEVTWEFFRWTLAAQYRFLSRRYGDLQEISPGLNECHVLGLRIDRQITPAWSLYARLDNLLSYTWQEWRGYPARGFTAVAGARISF